jgi:hypothetical protein
LFLSERADLLSKIHPLPGMINHPLQKGFT